MRPPVAASSAARSPAPLRRREKSPVKSGEYPASASRARASGESAYPYVTPASRARPSWRTEREEEEDDDDDDDGFEEEEEEEVDAFGLAEREQLDRRSIEPEGIEPDDDPGAGIDLDKFSAYAYANTRRPERWRDALTASFPDFGPAAGREACGSPGVDIRVDVNVKVHHHDDAAVSTYWLLIPPPPL
ncbi:hypothetical protein V498_09190 [Pseudogymnoascus sp. VKM F-4517 (FW-2822)]|nr:hypothetical protein V498_09190 [Pseudogymnoascus sp. VKM F-4517 (FW-2822)]